MFISENLVFTELHKTGGTHICKWMDRLVGGKQVGKHNRIPPSLWDKYIIGSIRNPWEWYVSLWAFGCGGQGSVYQQCTRRNDFRYLNTQLHVEMNMRRLSPVYWLKQCFHDAFKPVVSWRSVYRDHTDPRCFRDWLRMMYSLERRFDMGEGFGFSPVSKRFGLMTYRYLKLFTKLGDDLYKDPELSRRDGINRAFEANRLVNFMIRTEYLEEDLIEALLKAGCVLKVEERQAFFDARKNKTNTSKRLSVGYYYDQETIDLVADREQFIIDIHGYQPSVL